MNCGCGDISSEIGTSPRGGGGSEGWSDGVKWSSGWSITMSFFGVPGWAKCVWWSSSDAKRQMWHKWKEMMLIFYQDFFWGGGKKLGKFSEINCQIDWYQLKIIVYAHNFCRLTFQFQQLLLVRLSMDLWHHFLHHLLPANRKHRSPYNV